MSRTLRIDAINEILTSVGINTVASLDDPQRQDVIAAEQTLDEVLKHIATQDNFFNRYGKVEFDPDTNGFLLLPEDVYDVEYTESQDIQVLIKYNPTANDYCVFNLTDKTFVWDDSVVLDVTYYLTFEDLPEVVKRYVIASTARKLYLKLFGPSTHLQILAADEKIAYDILQRWEFDSGDYNMLNSPDVSRIWNTPRRMGRDR